MSSEMIRGSVFSCLREYIRELHPSYQFKLITEGSDALLGAKGFITFFVIFKELMGLDKNELTQSDELQFVRVVSQVEHDIFILRIFITYSKIEVSTMNFQNEALRIIINAAKSLGGGATCKASNDGFEWLLNFSLQKISD